MDRNGSLSPRPVAGPEGPARTRVRIVSALGRAAPAPARRAPVRAGRRRLHRGTDEVHDPGQPAGGIRAVGAAGRDGGCRRDPGCPPAFRVDHWRGEHLQGHQLRHPGMGGRLGHPGRWRDRIRAPVHRSLRARPRGAAATGSESVALTRSRDPPSMWPTDARCGSPATGWEALSDTVWSAACPTTGVSSNSRSSTIWEPRAESAATSRSRRG